MSVRIVRTSVIVVALILVGASFSLAAPGSVPVKFGFVAGGKMLEPGAYTVEVADGGKVLLTPAAGAPVELTQVRSLGRRKVARPELVFEEMGSIMYLSEVWVPEKEGVKVGGAAGAERRVTVAAKKTDDDK